jgi:hypothetical protein
LHVTHVASQVHPLHPHLFFSQPPHVTSIVTEEIKRERSLGKERSGGTSGDRDILTASQKSGRADQFKPGRGSDWFEGRDEPVGLREVRERDNRSGPDLTGKLCRRVMALIRWKVGADKAVTEHVVQALEEWLQRRGISIYTDWL